MKGYLTNQGVTAVEVLMSTGLLLVLLIPFYGLLYGSMKSYQAVETKVNHQQNLRIAMEAITTDLRQCTGLVERAVNVTLDDRNLLLMNGEQEIIWYYLSGEDLRWAIKKRGDSNFLAHNPVAGGITVLRFSYNRYPFSHSTQVTVWIEGTDELGQSYQLSSTVALRVDDAHGLKPR